MNKHLLRSLIVFLILLKSGTNLLFAQTLIWSDEFDKGTRPDPTSWTFNTGGSGFGNWELQFYTDRPENSRIENGNLVLEARKEDFNDKKFTSARVNTQGRFAFKYGIIEAKIKLPNISKGLWPAFWMLGTSIGTAGWPKCGEMDIMELGAKAALDAGTENSSVSAAMHWFHDANPAGQQTASYGNTTQIEGNFYDDYHVFKMDWSAQKAIFYVDDIKYHEMEITDPNLSEFHNYNFILINLAVGGTYTGISDPNAITAPFPAKMLVDYVRVYDNGSTELQLAKDTQKVGPFGIWTENTPVNSELDFGKADLWIWNNMTANGGDAYEGSSALSYTINPNNWYGMGIALREDMNLQRFKEGHLHMHVKTNSIDPIDFGFSSSGTNADGWVSVSGNSYGLIRDNQWHEVIIPLSKFGNLDFYTIKAIFMVKGGGPAAAFDLAFDNVYLTESVGLVAPQKGNFTLFSDNTPFAEQFKFGVDGELYLWDNTLAPSSNQTPFEGASSLSYSTTGKGWFGLGFTPNQNYNLTAFRFEDSKLHFALKTTTTTTFQIGVKSGNINDIGQKWITFKNGSDPYGFVRDGKWHEIEIPMSEISGVVDLGHVSQLFQILGFGEATDFEIDDIYYKNGGEAIIDTTTVPPPPALDRAPVVKFTSPLADDVLTGTVKVNVTAFDVNVGNVDGDGIASVKLQLLQGRNLVASFEDTSATYDWNLNTTQFTDGYYFLGATVTTKTEAGDTVLSNYIPVTIRNGSASLPPRQKSEKRGLGYGAHSVADMKAMKSGISWWYNWSPQPEASVRSTYPNNEVAFMPMVWGGNFDVNQVVAQIPAGAKYLLGFNEPNFKEQANLTPQQAAALWPKLEQIAAQKNLEIVGPAVNYCGGCVVEGQYDPTEYLDDFFAACTDCKVDYISIHWYACDRGALEWYIDKFRKYNKPIWITEIACWEKTPTLQDEINYMTAAVDVMEKDPLVDKYAWFQGRSNLLPAINVLGEQGQLSELGYLYATLPFEGMDTDPVVSITSPAANSELKGIVNISATANDATVGTTNGAGIAKVTFELLQGSNVVYSSIDNTAPYEIGLNTASLPNGAYTLKVTATGTVAAGGTSTSASLNVTIKNVVASGDPVVKFTRPVENAKLAGTINVNATAYDPDVNTKDGSGISYVMFQLLQGNTVVASLRENHRTYDWALNTKLYPDGAYTLKATAYSTSAAGGTSSSASIAVTIANPVHDPIVKFVRPLANSTLGGSVKVTVEAYDQDVATKNGSGIATVLIELVQGEKVIASILEKYVGYEWTLKTTDYPNGAYSLRATATSTKAAGGTTASISIPVNVFNKANVGRLAFGAQEEEISTYPNPSQTTLNIDLKGKNWEVLEVLSFSGDVLMVKPTEGETLVNMDVSKLASGIYYIRLKGKTIKVIKFIKE